MDHQTLIYLANIGLGAVLSLIIGLEREFNAKAAGMRTYAAVGMGSALFTVISKYGFFDVLSPAATGFDGSRVAAQVVSGIGFLGAGLIFVRRDAVRGLTTAAGIWFVAAIGMAAGAGLYAISGVSTVIYLVIMVGLRPISKVMPRARSTIGHYSIHYLDGHGVLREIMETLGKHGISALDLQVKGQSSIDGQPVQEILLTAQSDADSLANLVDDLRELQGVEAVATV